MENMMLGIFKYIGFFILYMLCAILVLGFGIVIYLDWKWFRKDGRDEKELP